MIDFVVIGIRCTSLPSQNGCLTICFQLNRLSTSFTSNPLSKFKKSVEGIVDNLFPFGFGRSFDVILSTN